MLFRLPPLRFLFVAFLILILILAWVFLIWGGGSPTLLAQQGLKPLRVGRAEFLVEVADTVVKKYQGLSGRANLPPDQGMLFTFPRPARRPFCMRGMLIPLDFVWIRDGVVVEVLTEVRPEDYPSLRPILPKESFDSVLELNSGAVEKFGLTVGDKVEF